MSYSRREIESCICHESASKFAENHILNEAHFLLLWSKMRFAVCRPCCLGANASMWSLPQFTSEKKVKRQKSKTRWLGSNALAKMFMHELCFCWKSRKSEGMGPFKGQWWVFAGRIWISRFPIMFTLLLSTLPCLCRYHRSSIPWLI